MTTKMKASDFFEKELGPMTFGAFLTAVRSLLEITQAELARKIKVSRSMICDIEKGRVLVSPALAHKIAKIAGFPSKFAIRFCLQDQLCRANLKMNVYVEAA